MNQDIDTKQSWHSIIMVMKSMIETLDDGTLVLTRRGLSVLSVCFFHISFLHYSNGSSSSSSNSNSTNNTSTSSTTHLSHDSTYNYDLCACMQILMQLCETVKHHLDKRTEGIRQIIQAWKEKSEVCKRSLMLVNFHNSAELRTRALELLRMVLSVSPNETLQYVIQLVWASYTSNQAQICMVYTTSTCNNSLTAVATSSGTPKQIQCTASMQLISQAVHLMGPQFPLNKKINIAHSSTHLR